MTASSAAQRHVQGDVDDRQSRRPAHLAARPEIEHHGEPLDAAQLGQQLGVAGIGVAGQVERPLVERSGGQAINFSGQRQPGRGDQGLVGRLSAAPIDHARRHVGRFVGTGGQTGEHVRLGLRTLDLVDRPNRQRRSEQRGRPSENLGIADHQRPAKTFVDQPPPGADDRFRPDAGRVAHGDGDSRQRSGLVLRIHAFDSK